MHIWAYSAGKQSLPVHAHLAEPIAKTQACSILAFSYLESEEVGYHCSKSLWDSWREEARRIFFTSDLKEWVQSAFSYPNALIGVNEYCK